MPDDPDGPEVADPIRVFLVDDHRVVRGGVSAYLKMVDGIEAVGEAADGSEALARIARLESGDGLPDVVLMDLSSSRAKAVSLMMLVITRVMAMVAATIAAPTPVPAEMCASTDYSCLVLHLLLEAGQAGNEGPQASPASYTASFRFGSRASGPDPAVAGPRNAAPPHALSSHRLAAVPEFYKARPGVRTYNVVRSPGASRRAPGGHSGHNAGTGYPSPDCSELF